MKTDQVDVRDTYVTKQLLIDTLRLFNSLGCTEKTDCSICCLINVCDLLMQLSSDMYDEMAIRYEVD